MQSLYCRIRSLAANRWRFFSTRLIDHAEEKTIFDSTNRLEAALSISHSLIVSAEIVESKECDANDLAQSESFDE